MPKKNKNENINGQQPGETAEDTVCNCENCAEPPPEETPASSSGDKLKEQLDAERDRFLRLAAEYENYRKRSQKEREALFQDVKAEMVLKMLPVYDNLERALSAKCEDEAFYKGVEMIMTQFMDILAKLDINLIPALNESFDPELHNAVMHVEDDKAGQGVIVEEFQKGFIMGGSKVIRYSTVKVAN